MKHLGSVILLSLGRLCYQAWAVVRCPRNTDSRKRAPRSFLSKVSISTLDMFMLLFYFWPDWFLLCFKIFLVCYWWVQLTISIHFRLMLFCLFNKMRFWQIPSRRFCLLWVDHVGTSTHSYPPIPTISL